MNTSLRIALLASSLPLMTRSLLSKTAIEFAPAHTLSIRLYDQAEVPGEVLRLGIAESDRLFHAAGIRVLWERPLTECPNDRGTDMTSKAFQQLDTRRYLVVRLIPQIPATVLPGALGYALPFAHAGAHVLIFYDRVEALARLVNTDRYVILGHALAHETAHVLIGTSEHSAGGMMEARWTFADWRLASAGLITFRRQEIERMRAGLRRFQSP